MDTIWLKIVGFAVLVIGAIVMIGYLTSGTNEPQKTIYDQWEQDDKELLAEPEFKEPPPPAPTSPAPQPAPTQAVQPSAPTAPVQPAEQPKPQFKELDMEDEVEAQKLWIWVENQRKMGRLPVMGYGQMVKGCRDIIQRWPESKYAFFAKRALADLPERYREMYNITDEEIDLGNLK
ncbi:MAG: hypothetical protein ACYSUX_18845 [Planctomycetota bacterium]|jgi:hypothetical protein